MKSRRRSFFTTGILLSALVLFGATAAQAQPSDVNALPAGYSSIVVTWSAPGGGLDDVARYEIGYAVKPALSTVTANNFNDLGPKKMTAAKSLVSATIGDLKAGTDYVVGVRTVSTDSPAVMSDWDIDEATTVALPTVGKVMDLRLEAGDGMIMAMWDAVSDTIGIHHYKVKVTSGGGFSLTVGTGSSDPDYTIMNLANGTEYTVQVMAVGENQDGSADANADGEPDRPGAFSDKKKATPMADGDMEDEDEDEEPPMETPALPIAGILALGAGLLAAGRRRLRL